MPSSMTAEYNETPDLTSNDLDTQVITLLFDIVRRAQTSPDPSDRRALFTAYEEVLDENGLGPEDDDVLHKFLHRLQRDESVGEDLEQRFLRVLGEFRIQIDYSDEGEGEEATHDVNETRDPGGDGNSSRERLERTSSFESFFDGSADKIAGLPLDAPRRQRNGSLDSLGSLRSGEDDGWKKRRSRSDTEAPSYGQVLPLRPKPNGHLNRRTASGPHAGHRRRGSVSSRGSLRITRDDSTTASRFDETDHVIYDSEHTAPTANITKAINLSNVQIPGVNAPIPESLPESRPPTQPYEPEPFRPSDTRLLDDAETFEQQRVHSLARVCLQKWGARLRECNDRAEKMDRIATAFYRANLLKAFLKDLKIEAQNRRSNHETERFFGKLEKRAEKARSLFLLTKAFTHWARSAEDEVQRTSVARRHILRTRLFNGWRDITVVNELKIQQFVLGKFLKLWYRRTVEIRIQHAAAVQVCNGNLLRRYYKNWFFGFCEIAAPGWHELHLKRHTFHRWHEIATVLKERERWTIDRREREVARRALAVWKQKVQAVQALQPQADDFRRKAMLKTALCALQRQAQLAPLLSQCRGKTTSRLVRSTFQTWQRSAQLSRQARKVDQMRIMRNAWTAWNDNLRIKALEERINDRVLVETMYKWTLASRVSLFQRVHDRKLKENVMLTWVTKTNECRNTLDSAERRFAQFKRTQRLRSCLRKIEAATAERRAEEFAITVEYDRKIKQRIFDKLLDKHEHFQRLDGWAGDAQFYVFAKRTLKRWNDATQLARRNRRRELYAQVRRNVKLNLVKRVFGVWREKAEYAQIHTQQAEEISHNRTLENSRMLLTHWRSRATALRINDQRATDHYTRHLQERHLDALSQRMNVLRAMDMQAVALLQENTEIAAASALKKLGWKLWNVQRREENAIALHQRNFEKHVRAMIRFWFEQTVERAAQRPVSPTPTGRSHGRNDDADDEEEDVEDPDNADDDTRRLETWTAFDNGALSLSNLDLSLSLSPQSHPPSTLAPSARPAPPPVHRPQTFPQPHSALRQRPPPIPEDTTFDDPNTFWTSTPMPPRPAAPRNPPSTLNPDSGHHAIPPPPPQSQTHNDVSVIQPPTTGKAGYLKTPSKRSLARSKRPELPISLSAASPEKGRVGVRSAPPMSRVVHFGGGGGITSFERRMRLGGFGGQRVEGGKKVGLGDVGGGEGAGNG